MPEKINVLIVQGEAHDRDPLVNALAAAGFPFSQALDLEDAAARHAEGPFDIAVVDLAGEDPATFNRLTRMQELLPGLPMIALVADGVDNRLDAIRNGAQDVLARDTLSGQNVAEVVQCALMRTRLARVDSLTGLANRAVLMDRLSHAIDHARRYDKILAVMFLDLDRFKRINDNKGHAAGDRVIQTVATRLRECLRGSDTVARLGGDEFAAVLDTLPRDIAAAEVAQKLIDRISEPITIGDDTLTVAPSIGIGIYPSDGDDADQLLQCADAAMYAAKSRGGGAYVFHRPDMNAQDLRRMGLAFALRGGLQREEFELHYQPRLSLASSRVVGVEALLRWCHPQRGLVGPDYFAPIAQDLGLMTPIGRWAIGKACAQQQVWRARGLAPLGLSINLSPDEFEQPDLVANLEASLECWSLPAADLEIELPADYVMSGSDNLVGNLEKLKRLGVRLAVDGFGDGMISLPVLRQMPIQTVKIKRAIIAGLLTDPDCDALVCAIIQIAASLDLDVVAMGIENAPQMARLQALKCAMAQGFAVGRPVPAEALPDLIAVIENRRIDNFRDAQPAVAGEVCTRQAGVA